MIEISIDQFKADPEKYTRSVIGDGDIISMDTGHGKMVMMEEAEYEMLRQALEMLIAIEGTK
jgi:PHD/YefM family antitoxin component YafN of YafNO toxin-antitoxin module